MYGSETFATDVSSTSMIVASIIDIAINHGLTLGFHSLGSGAAVSALILPLPYPPDPQRRPYDYSACKNYGDDADHERRSGSMIHRDRRNHGHPWSKHALQLLSLVEHNFYRHALNNLHIIVRCIFRRQQGESSAAPGLNTVHVSAQFQIWVSVHRNVYRSPRLHVPKLRFLEI